MLSCLSILNRLLFDPDRRIQEQALIFLRNLVCGKEESDIERVFFGLGSDLMSHLERFMQGDRDELIVQVKRKAALGLSDLDLGYNITILGVFFMI